MAVMNNTIFRPLSGDDPDPEISEIESLCLSCGKNGTTRLLMTKIPYFKEVVIMSFDCIHCGFQNNEIQPGGTIEEKGVRIILSVKTHEDLNRQVVKSDYTSIKIPDIDFEIPAQSQKGGVTTVEGILQRIVEGLSQDQTERRKLHPELAEKLNNYIGKVKSLKELAFPFKMIFEDISGNSFVSNPNAPYKDHGCENHLFVRDKDQDHVLGIYTSSEISNESSTAFPTSNFTLEDLNSEVLQFQTNCPNCTAPCNTNMKVTSIL
uniref:Zinc finger ZPR1-type domain-containing protein n=1 Tax=Clastoptera arizonana TaxID=38151 RepID=A0A1B6BZW2_9HEMI